MLDGKVNTAAARKIITTMSARTFTYPVLSGLHGAGEAQVGLRNIRGRSRTRCRQAGPPIACNEACICSAVPSKVFSQPPANSVATQQPG